MRPTRVSGVRFFIVPFLSIIPALFHSAKLHVRSMPCLVLTLNYRLYIALKLTASKNAKVAGGIELVAIADIIRLMRKPVLFLMIALLAVRGWAGAVMSVEMSLQSLTAVPAMASSVNGAGPVAAVTFEMPIRSSADCPDHASMQPAADETAKSSSHCNTCVACQICHTVALTGVAPLTVAPLGAYSPIIPGGTRFASAALRTGFKPPIS